MKLCAPLNNAISNDGKERTVARSAAGKFGGSRRVGWRRNAVSKNARLRVRKRTELDFACGSIKHASVREAADRPAGWRNILDRVSERTRGRCSIQNHVEWGAGNVSIWKFAPDER